MNLHTWWFVQRASATLPGYWPGPRRVQGPVFAQPAMGHGLLSNVNTAPGGNSVYQDQEKLASDGSV